MTAKSATRAGYCWSSCAVAASVMTMSPRWTRPEVPGWQLENAMVAGICSMGVDAFVIGPLPTPGVAFITQSMRADAGVMISASHNLFQDNGIKFFHRDGYKLPDEDEEEMERLIFSDRLSQFTITNEGSREVILLSMSLSYVCAHLTFR